MNGQEIICIDHHPIYDPVDYRFSDIRPDVGACASIIATYYFDNNIDMSEMLQQHFFMVLKWIQQI